MSKKTVALSIEEQVYNKYRAYCEKKGIILSKQVENFMEEELKKKW
jgi:hypothetical protein